MGSFAGMIFSIGDHSRIAEPMVRIYSSFHKFQNPFGIVRTEMIVCSMAQRNWRVRFKCTFNMQE